MFKNILNIFKKGNNINEEIIDSDNKPIKLKSPEYLARGYFGCVYEPSLYCDDKKKLRDIDPETNIPKYYKNKISKVLTTKSAERELSEYDNISKIPGFEDFYLGVPEMCNIMPKQINFNQTGQCSSKIESDIDNYRLLIMKNGGIDLDELAFLNYQKNEYLNNKHNVQHFIFEYFRMLYGIKKLVQHEIIHFDLRLNNILYDVTTKKLNFIDFGIAFNFDKLNNLLLNLLKKRHFIIRPPDLWLNKLFLPEYKKGEIKDITLYDVKYFFNFDVYSMMIVYIENTFNINNKGIKNFYYTNCKKCLEYFISNENNKEQIIEEFERKQRTTIDLYMYMLTLLRFMYYSNIKAHLSSEEIEDLNDIIYKCINPNVFERNSVDSTIEDFIVFFNKHNWIASNIDYINKNIKYMADVDRRGLKLDVPTKKEYQDFVKKDNEINDVILNKLEKRQSKPKTTLRTKKSSISSRRLRRLTFSSKLKKSRSSRSSKLKI